MEKTIEELFKKNIFKMPSNNRLIIDVSNNNFSIDMSNKRIIIKLLENKQNTCEKMVDEKIFKKMKNKIDEINCNCDEEMSCHEMYYYDALITYGYSVMAKLGHQHYYFNKNYKYGNDGNWYEFEKHKWKQTNSISIMTQLSVNCTMKMKELFKKLLKYCVEIDMDIGKLNYIKSMKKFIMNDTKMEYIASSIKANLILSEEENDFVEKLDANKNLIGFKNGVYDLSSHTFRNGKPEDNITLTTKYNYAPTFSEKYNELVKFLEDIQPNREERENLLMYLSQVLCENTFDESFVVLIGNGNNGKSKLIELIKKTFGKYVKFVNESQFTTKTNLPNLRGKKMVVINESEKTMSSEFVKFMTTELRKCYKNKKTNFLSRNSDKLSLSRNSKELLDKSPLLLFVSNEMFEMSNENLELNEKIKYVNFSTEFCENPVSANQKLVNKKINENFDNWKMDFMLLLIHYHQKYGNMK